MQRTFSKPLFFSCLGLIAPILVLEAWGQAQPNRVALSDALVVGRAEPVATATTLPGPVAAARMWRLTAPDPRFGGLSGVTVQDDGLLALTDSGVIVRFRPPRHARQPLAIHLHDLPDGPGDGRRKRGRDSEAILADPRGLGWWIAFEGAHSLWLFDPGLSRVLARVSLDADWSSNSGAEALVASPGGAVFALPEGGGEAVGQGISPVIAPAGTSDAARLPDGRLVLLVRRFGWRGFVNEVRIVEDANKPPRTIRLPLAPLDNAEAITAAPLANGGTRLWILTDNNFRPWMRTLLVALDLPPSA